MVQHCWDRPRIHHGPCCMDCVIEETDRQAGASIDGAVRETHVRQGDGSLVAVVRACCYHWNWQDEAVAEVIAQR